MNLERILEPDTLGVLFAIIAVIVTGLVVVARIYVRHRERMAMIGMGRDPDSELKAPTSAYSSGPARPADQRHAS